MTSAGTVLVATLLPWLFGAMVARLLSGPGRPTLLYLGLGYILGTLTIVWLIKAWDASGWSLHFWPMAGALLLCTIFVLAGMLRLKQPCSAIPVAQPNHDSRAWQRAVMLLFLVALSFHLLFIMQELLLRPTFPWDAWRGWEPKVIQFYANRSLEAPMGTIGNYGEISTHALLWMMLASEATHEPFLHLPWLFAYLALAAIIYGYLLERFSRLVAILGAYMVISLPYLSSHVALAGYADIWLALAFTVGVLALSDFRRNHRYRQLVLALLMTIACLQAKRAGIGFAAVLLALVLIEAGLRASRPIGFTISIVIAVLGGVLGATLLGYIDLKLPLPRGHRLLFSSEEFRVTGLLRFTFNPEWQPKPFYEALLQFSNWQLLAYLWLGIAGLVLMLRKWSQLAQTENLGILAGLTVTVLYFSLASPETALDHTGLSRTLLYIMPLAIMWLLTTCSQLMESCHQK